MKNLKVLILISMILLALTDLASAGETLYNGIELPDQWPPDYGELSLEVMEVPYLEAPPAVIRIAKEMNNVYDDPAYANLSA